MTKVLVKCSEYNQSFRKIFEKHSSVPDSLPRRHQPVQTDDVHRHEK